MTSLAAYVLSRKGFYLKKVLMFYAVFTMFFSGGLIPYYLVDAVIEAPYGSHPGEMAYRYRRDEAHIKDWVEASCDEESTQAYLKKYIYDLKDQQEYLAFIGQERLQSVTKGK